MHTWLSTDIQHIVAVNCRAGKGRTGTLICCYLIYSGRISDPSQALKYYQAKRFTKGGGVTQPSQIRYVHYFADIFHGRVKCPLVSKLSKIQFLTLPNWAGFSCKPVIEIYKDNHIIYTNKIGSRENQKIILDN